MSQCMHNLMRLDWSAVGEALQTMGLFVKPLLPLHSRSKSIEEVMQGKRDADLMHCTCNLVAKACCNWSQALVEPLKDLSRPGDVLVLCPAKELYMVPLHALQLGGQHLIERNPCTYTPSLSILGQCTSRGRPGSGGAKFFFGDASEDRPECGQAVQDIADRMHVLRENVYQHKQVPCALFQSEQTAAPFVVSLDTAHFPRSARGCATSGKAPSCLSCSATAEGIFMQADLNAFKAAAAQQPSLLHFQGHARHSESPLESCLQFSDGELRARDILKMPPIQVHSISSLYLSSIHDSSRHQTSPMTPNIIRHQ